MHDEYVSLRTHTDVHPEDAALITCSAFFQEAWTGGSMSTRSGFQHSCIAQAAVLKKPIEVALKAWNSHEGFVRDHWEFADSLLFQRFFISFTTKLP